MSETNPISEWSLGNSQRRPSQLITLEILKPLQKRQDTQGMLFLIVHLGLLVLTGYVLQLTMETPWLIFGLVLHGVVLVHLFAPFHEATHQSAFLTRWLNHAVAWFTGLVIMIPPLYFKLEHAAHHTYTQHPEKDLESIPQAQDLLGILVLPHGNPLLQGSVKKSSTSSTRVNFLSWNSLSFQSVFARKFSAKHKGCYCSISCCWVEACFQAALYCSGTGFSREFLQNL
jgi:fatty-acid desaturase